MAATVVIIAKRPANCPNLWFQGCSACQSSGTPSEPKAKMQLAGCFCAESSNG
jgi:hypothetical protein